MSYRNAPKDTAANDEGWRAEALVELIKINYGQWNVRRDYEFKVTLAFWTALALAIAGSQTLGRPLEIDPFWGWTCGVIIVVVHVHWNIGLWWANQGDKGIARFYERALGDLIGHPLTDEERKKWKLGQFEPKPGDSMWVKTSKFPMRFWSHFTQVVVTAMLVVVLVYLNTRPITRPAKDELEVEQLKLQIQKLQKEMAPPPATMPTQALAPSPNSVPQEPTAAP